MNIGLDYWQVCSHYPGYLRELARAHLAQGNEVHIISAIGKGRSGTIAAEVAELGLPSSGVHEVIFRHPRESPQLKLAKCVELGIQVFYDDREDVCRLLNQHGILALHVLRQDPPPTTYPPTTYPPNAALRQPAWTLTTPGDPSRRRPEDRTTGPALVS